MKRIAHLFLFFLLMLPFGKSQNTFSRVYEIFQQKCVSCHGNTAPEAGLNLQGAGANLVTKETVVFNNLVNKAPSNVYAAGKAMKLIYPGRPDRSWLFHKINKGLEPTLGAPGDGSQQMPPNGSTDLTTVEKELIRQWILYGAIRLGKVVEEPLLTDYYAGNGLKSFPAGPPASPPSNEGFQFKMGPFYLQPSGQPLDELEFFQKYELNLPADVEVKQIDMHFSSSSHHFIIYRFNPGGDRFIAPGLRLDANHSDINLVAAVQEPIELKLPKGTAFKWPKDVVLDLNSHYINYSASQNYQAEVYINVYTQPVGTAKHEMKTDLLANVNIPIPNNGNTITHTQSIFPNLGEVFLWGIMGHTHKYGRDYKVYKRVNGAKGELIYDASCPRGIPGCSSPYFDYRHIPMRYHEPLTPLTFNLTRGIIHEAKWVNNGPSSVNFGPTSNDEMMVLVMMYTTDTTGIIYSNANDLPTEPFPANFYPNPFEETAWLDLYDTENPFTLELFDLAGKSVRKEIITGGRHVPFDKKNLRKGIYFLRITDENGRIRTLKIVAN